MSALKLVSSHLCPYVQRAAISVAEKGQPVERIFVDPADKPEWFGRASPLGKVPLLMVGDDVIFESSVILEFLEDTVLPQLHPADPLRRADHRAWIEFGSAVLADIAALYRAPDPAAFEAKRTLLTERFARLEQRVVAAPWFDGDTFSLVDAVYGPVFRYFDLFDEIADFRILAGKPRVARWRSALAARPSIREAVSPDYPSRLRAFVVALDSHLAGLMAARLPAATLAAAP